MSWSPLEDAKKKAAAILGSDKDIPNEKADLNKLFQARSDAYNAANAAAGSLADKLDAVLDAIGKANEAVKQTAAIYQKDDFGLDKKADGQKIAKVRKCFDFLSGFGDYDRELGDLKKTRATVKGLFGGG